MIVKCRKCFKRGYIDQKGFLPPWSDGARLLPCPVPWSSSPWGWACNPYDCMQARSGLAQMTTRIMHIGNQCLCRHHINTNSPPMNKTGTNSLILFLCISNWIMHVGWLLLGHAYTCTCNLPIFVQKWVSPVPDPHLWSSPQQTLVSGLSSATLQITFPRWFHLCNICT